MLKIPRTVFDDLRRHGEQTYPHECCGILLGTADAEQNHRMVTRSVRCGNTRADSPRNRYHIDERELIAAQKQARERGEDIIGFYHSHPDHPARWSATDLAEAHWLGCSYVITAVAKGQADVTQSFALVGALEEEKRFVNEELVVQESGSGLSAPQ